MLTTITLATGAMLLGGMVRRQRTLSLLCWLALAGCGPSGTVPDYPICDSLELNRALKVARDGDVVRIGECEVTLWEDVGSGVTLEGVSPDQSVIRGGVTLKTRGDATTILRDLTVMDDGIHGTVRPEGLGSVLIEDVSIEHAVWRMAISASRLARLTLRRVQALGPASLTDAEHPGFAADLVFSRDERIAAGGPRSSPFFHIGVYIDGVDDVRFEDVQVAGFAGSALVVREATTFTWQGGTLSESFVCGACFIGEEMAIALNDVTVRDTMRWLGGIEAYGVRVSDDSGGSAFESTNLRIERTDGVALRLDGATGTLQALTARDQRGHGVWVSDADGFRMDGTVSNSGFAGILLDRVAGAVLADATVEGTVARVLTFGDSFGQPGTTFEGFGDGVVLERSTTDVRLSRAVIRDNARAGLLVDLDGTDGEGVAFDDVQVAHGADTNSAGAVSGDLDTSESTLTVRQPTGWDEGIVRSADTQAVDDGVGGALPMPPEPPEPVLGMGLELMEE